MVLVPLASWLLLSWPIKSYLGRSTKPDEKVGALWGASSFRFSDFDRYVRLAKEQPRGSVGVRNDACCSRAVRKLAALASCVIAHDIEDQMKLLAYVVCICIATPALAQRTTVETASAYRNAPRLRLVETSKRLFAISKTSRRQFPRGTAVSLPLTIGARFVNSIAPDR